MTRTVVLGLGIIVAITAVLIIVAWWFQRSLIYFPFGTVPAPHEVGLAATEDAVVETPDGVELGVWYVPGDEGATAIVFNGNAGNRSLRAPLATALSDMGLGVVLFDYRGYGDSTGRPSQEGLLTDARAIRDWLVAQPGVDPDGLVYVGESLGAAVASGLAVDHAPAAMVLRSPFTSLAEVGRVHYPILPVGLLLRDRYPVKEWISGYDGPLLVLYGEGDRIVPPQLSRQVHAAAPGDAQLVAVPDADHNDPALSTGDVVVTETRRFLAQVLDR